MCRLDRERQDARVRKPSRQFGGQLTLQLPETEQRPAGQDDRLALNLEPLRDRVRRTREFLRGHRHQMTGDAVTFICGFADVARERGDGARPGSAFIDFPDEVTRPFDTIVREHALRQLCLLSTAIGCAKHSPQRQTAQPIAAALVTKHIAPAAGTRAAPLGVAAIGDRASAGNHDGTRLSRHTGLEGNQRVVDDDGARTLPDALENAADDFGIAYPVDACHSKTDRDWWRTAVDRPGDDVVQNLFNVELACRLKICALPANLRNRLTVVVGQHAHGTRAAGINSEQTHSGEAYLIEGLFWYAGGVLSVRDPRFDAAAAIITEGLETRAFPAASVDVGTSSGPVWQQAFGRLTYEDFASSASPDTVFDLASLTKVIATSSIAMHQVQAGLISLGTRVSEVLAVCGQSPVGAIVIRQLLDHSSGLPAHLRLWERASGREAFMSAICGTKLDREPGTASVYSDPGFLLLGFALEESGDGRLDEQFRNLLGDGDRTGPLLYCPPADLLERIAPTEHDKWRGRVLRGEVHDENAAALGGVAAHAGLFGTAASVGGFARTVLRTFKEPTELGSPNAMRLFSSKTGVPGSSRALGWDTALPTSSSGTRMSDRAIGHTGFTGTSLWIDPGRDMYAVLLTNRVHPARTNEKLLPLRGRFHDALPF